METTPKVVSKSDESIDPNAPKRSARIPPNPVTFVATPNFSKFAVRSVRINLIILGSAGLSSIFSVATFEFSGMLASAACPSCEGTATNGAPGIMYSDNELSVPGLFRLIL